MGWKSKKKINKALLHLKQQHNHMLRLNKVKAIICYLCELEQVTEPVWASRSLVVNKLIVAISVFIGVLIEMMALIHV